MDLEKLRKELMYYHLMHFRDCQYCMEWDKEETECEEFNGSNHCFKDKRFAEEIIKIVEGLG